MAQVLRRLVVSAAMVGVTAGGLVVPAVPALADPPHKSNPSQDNDACEVAENTLTPDAPCGDEECSCGDRKTPGRLPEWRP